MPRFVQSLRLESAARTAALDALVTDEDALVRCRTLLALPVAERDVLCFDPDPSVARLATSMLAGGRPTNVVDSARERQLTLLRRSPHATVRRLAREASAQSSILHAPGMLAARRLLRVDRDGLMATMRSLLAGEKTQLAALPVVERLGIVDEVFDQVVVLAQGTRTSSAQTTDHVAARAVSVLSTSRQSRARVVITSCLDHPDPRVRANAVDALARLDRRGLPDAVESMVDDDHHRIRANVIRASLASRGELKRIYEPAAVDALRAMLRDERAAHRLSGVWLAQRVLAGEGRARVGQAWGALASTITAIANEDTDVGVRQRARRCAKRLHQEVRHAWSKEVAS
ncbi:MAG: HEAT repeat domain-containing protein, partial [Phycisphaerales bacterium]|nr:HEAT repeat domain-containing protein [Phycisphaerales bacterium]